MSKLVLHVRTQVPVGLDVMGEIGTPSIVLRIFVVIGQQCISVS
jgi:hypothetical protein